jgi:hypothetical protein
MKAFASSRDAPNFQANNPLFKERVPDLHVAYRSRGLAPSRPANVALHDASFASDHRVRGGGGMLLRLRARTGFPLTFLFGSFPAGPHERCRRSTTRSAFHRWVGTVRPSRVSSLGLGPPFRRGRDHDERERTRYRSPTSATDVKVEHTRERPVTPRAGRELDAGVGHRRPRAAEHRLPGWESSSRSAGRPDPTRLRHEAREACSNRSGYPCRARTRSGSQERLPLAPGPEARLRPAARTVRPSNEPGYLHTARNRDCCTAALR